MKILVMTYEEASLYVGNIEDPSTYRTLIDYLAPEISNLANDVSVEEVEFKLSIKEMTQSEVDSLPDFDGF